jgi:hypothetical protein
VTRYLLDTNIISEAVRPEPAPALLAWWARQDDTDLFIAALSLAEVRRGILEQPQGRRRRSLEAWFAGSEGPQALFAGRILPFDERAALVWAELMAGGSTAGRPRSALDMIIASVARANGCIVVTGNERHFQKVVDMINPLRD